MKISYRKLEVANFYGQYNYADDNTLSYGHPDFNVLTSVLESESNVLINWFKVNKMQANPDKFQVLAVGKKTFDKT